MIITKQTTELRHLDYNTGQTILIDKPLKWTSFNVVAAVRKIVGVKKVGHSGTLDPLATGLLILCTGRKTKDLENYIGLEKTYTGTILLGKFSQTMDLESEVKEVRIPNDVNEKKILDVKGKFVGEIFQKPPMFSAKKINGKRLYKYARKGKEIEVKPRKITVHEFEITSVNLPEILFRIRCSKGTYIRSIAHEFGKELGSAAVLSSLRRTGIGSFNVNEALSINEFVQRFKLKGTYNMANS